MSLGETMKRWLTVFGVVVALARLSSAEDAPNHSPGNLSISIAAAKDGTGSWTIDRGGVFSVVFTNRSDKPLRLWSERCQLGYETLSFRVAAGDKGPTLMSQKPRVASDWRNKPPETLNIAPGGTFTWEVAPSSIWGEREWRGVPEPNTGKPVELTAVFEIKPSDAAKEGGVWTGRVTSAPVATLFIDPKLRTVHQYLREDCPQQALRIMQADKAQISVRDEYEQTPLHLAASYGFTDVVRWLLAQGADVNSTAYNRFTPLHLARDPETAKLLLEHKADVNAENSSGRTALEEAASNCAHRMQFPDYRAEQDKSRALTKVLLDGGAEYDIRSACYLGDVERVRVLVADKHQALDRTAMRAAATYGSADIVKLLLSRGADPEDADYGGLPLSYFAIEHAAVLKLLFDAGADPKVVVRYRGDGKGPEGSTLLHEAAKKGAVESVKLLLARGLNVNARTPFEATPLHEACRAGHADMVNLLLRHKANPKIQTAHGASPLSLAAMEIRPEHEEDNARYQSVIRSLQRGGIEVDLFAAIAINDIKRVGEFIRSDPKCVASSDLSGRPGLHRAVTLDRREIAKLLLDSGCTPDIRSADTDSGHEQETALLNAAFWGRTEITEILIKKGANVNATAKNGVAPLHEAARMRQIAVARLLLKHGADVNIKDNSGETPLDWAELYGRATEMYELLTSHGGRSKDSK